MQKIMIPLGGEERRVKFTINAIQELEGQLASKNVMSLMQEGAVWSVTDTVSACYCALRVFDNAVTRKKVEAWVAEYAEGHETGIYGLQAYLVAAIGLSGLVGGKKSAFEGILRMLSQDGEATDEGK